MKSDPGSIAHSVRVFLSAFVSAVIWASFLLAILVFVRHIRQIYWRHFEQAQLEITSARLHYDGFCVTLPAQQVRFLWVSLRGVHCLLSPPVPQLLNDRNCRKHAETLEKDPDHIAMSLTYDDLGAGFHQSFLGIFLLSLRSPWYVLSLSRTVLHCLVLTLTLSRRAFASLIVIISAIWLAVSVVKPVWGFLTPPSLPDYDRKKRE
jgi:hypothetical protein